MIVFIIPFEDDDIELERRPSDDEGDNEAAETLQAEQEKRRLERLDREKWLKGNVPNFVSRWVAQKAKFCGDIFSPMHMERY